MMYCSILAECIPGMGGCLQTLSACSSQQPVSMQPLLYTADFRQGASLPPADRCLSLSLSPPILHIFSAGLVPGCRRAGSLTGSPSMSISMQSRQLIMACGRPTPHIPDKVAPSVTTARRLITGRMSGGCLWQVCTRCLYPDGWLTCAGVQEKTKLLTFVVVGGGPTGVEVAAGAALPCRPRTYDHSTDCTLYTVHRTHVQLQPCCSCVPVCMGRPSLQGRDARLVLAKEVGMCNGGMISCVLWCAPAQEQHRPKTRCRAINM